MPDLAEVVAAGQRKDALLLLYIPSADRDGAALGREVQKQWVREALRLLGRELEGGTAFPRGLGVWKDNARGGNLVWDKPVIVQSYTTEEAMAEKGRQIIAFALRMGRETNQGAVALVFNDTFVLFESPIDPS